MCCFPNVYIYRASPKHGIHSSIMSSLSPVFTALLFVFVTSVLSLNTTTTVGLPTTTTTTVTVKPVAPNATTVAVVPVTANATTLAVKPPTNTTTIVAVALVAANATTVAVKPVAANATTVAVKPATNTTTTVAVKPVAANVTTKAPIAICRAQSRCPKTHFCNLKQRVCMPKYALNSTCSHNYECSGNKCHDKKCRQPCDSDKGCSLAKEYCTISKYCLTKHCGRCVRNAQCANNNCRFFHCASSTCPAALSNLLKKA